MNVNYRLALGEAWSAAMAIYKQGHVNSECTLHSILHAQLVKNLPDCVVLCEPQLQMGSHGTFVPDIVVLRGTQVEVVLELKFVPHGYPVYEADISKLRAIGNGDSSATHSLLIDPATGKFVDKPGVVGRDSLLVFAAVGQSDAAAVDQDKLTSALIAGGQEALASRFLALLEKVPARP